jgi:Fe-S-cluster containining protein
MPALAAADDEIRRLHAWLEERLAGVLEQARAAGAKPPCRAGCAWCCSEPVFVSRREAALLAARVRQMPADERRAVEAAVRQWASRFLASDLAKIARPKALEYRRLGLPCPLLADGLCRVYDDRPVGCRLHIAWNDEAACREDERRPKQRFVQAPALDLAAGLAMVCASGGRAEFDHLGLLLYGELFGEQIESASAVVVTLGDETEGEMAEPGTA